MIPPWACCMGEAPALAPRQNSSWWRHWIWCLRIDEVAEKGEDNELVHFWQHAHDKSLWVRTTLIKLNCPPDRMLWNHLHATITTFTETKQYWSLLPRNEITYHTFTILNIGDTDLHILLERKDNQLEMIIGNGKGALEFMKCFRAVVRPRKVDLCEEQPSCKLGSKVTVGQLLEWVDGLQKTWQPYDLLVANCQHFSRDLREFLLDPQSDSLKDRGFHRIRQQVLLTVKSKARALLDAPLALQLDRHFVLAVVGRNGRALRYAADDFRHDFRVVITAIAQNADALQDVPPRLRGDRELVLTAAQANGLVLAHVGEAFQDDREIVLAAVRQNGLALQYTGTGLRRDREVLIAAGWQNPAALRFAQNSAARTGQLQNSGALDQWYFRVPRSLSAF